MDELLGVLVLFAVCWYFYKSGKQRGSRGGFYAGRKSRGRGGRT